MRPASPLARNTLSNFAVQAWSVVIAFASTPYIVHGLGPDAYGVFSALAVLLGYLSFLDLGFGWGLIKFVADYTARDDHDRAGEAVATTLAAFALLGGCAALGVWLLAPWFVAHGLNVPGALRPTAVLALRLSAVAFTASLLGGVYSGVLRGWQRFEIANLIQVTTGTAQVGLAVAAIGLGWGLLGVCAASVATSVASTAALWAVVRASGVLPQRTRPTLAMLRVLGSFSAYSALSRLGTQTLYQMEKVFLGLLLPVAALGYYMVPFNLAFKVAGIATSFGTAFFPAVSGLRAEGRPRQAAALLESAQRYLVFSLLPPMAFVFATAPQILGAWIGPEFAEQGSTPLSVLVLAFFVNGVCSLDAIALDAAGFPEATARQVTIAAGANLVTAGPLVWAFGTTGAAVALLLSMGTLTLGVWRSAARLELLPSLRARLWGTVGRALAVAAPLVVALCVVLPPRPSLPALLASGLAFAATAYALLALAYLRAEDRRHLWALGARALGGLAAHRPAAVRRDVAEARQP